MRAVVGSALGNTIPVIGYDIQDAIESGSGGWSHTYKAPSRQYELSRMLPETTGHGCRLFERNGNAYGVVGTNTTDIQLFVQRNPQGREEMAKIITLKLSRQALVGKIRLYGRNMDYNLFTGQITAATVEIGGQSIHLTTIPAGSTNFLRRSVRRHPRSHEFLAL